MKRGARVLWGLSALVVAVGGGIALSWWNTLTHAVAATAYQGLRWQADLGLTAYNPGAGLVAPGSQADLLGRYLTLMDEEAEHEAGWTPVAGRLQHVRVWNQSIGVQGGYVQYLVTETRTLSHQGHRETSTVTGLVTVWVSPGVNRAWAVTGLSYNFNPLTPPTAAPTVSYTQELLTPEAASPLGTTGGP
jgi:hypothetical protein